MDRKIISLVKRKDFIFRLSDIHGSLNAFFDYGLIRVELKLNIKEFSSTNVATRHDNLIGIDCPSFHFKNVESFGTFCRIFRSHGRLQRIKDAIAGRSTIFANIILNIELIGYICLQGYDDVKDTAKKQPKRSKNRKS
jgi:hypothetical protein